MNVSLRLEEWALITPFRISGQEWTTTPTLMVELERDGFVGRGEGQGIFFLGETAESMFIQADVVVNTLRAGITREELLQLLPPGGARNAIDCALWDLECKSSGRTIWHLTGIEQKPVQTVFTIGLEPQPEEMAEKAAQASSESLLKIKLNDDRPYERLAAIRAVRPDAELIVDANQGWTIELLRDIVPGCKELGVHLIEQPLPRGQDSALDHFESEIALAADESILDVNELKSVFSRYDVINIKLDKCGGLTAALTLARAALAAGVKLMVGNMAGTSLAMAPSLVVAQLCEYVDLDGPLLLKYDRANGLRYHHGEIGELNPSLWG
jgi:L-alanine-DL-glutamate epimerase-like enolase superfamily enzyme